MWSDYSALSGSVGGEIKNEIYNRYGQEIMESAILGWDEVTIDELTRKTYTLVNCNPRQFLVATVKYYPFVREDSSGPKRIVATFMPETIHLEWVATNIEFLPKYVLDERGISYSL